MHCEPDEHGTEHEEREDELDRTGDDVDGLVLGDAFPHFVATNALVATRGVVHVDAVAVEAHEAVDEDGVCVVALLEPVEHVETGVRVVEVVICDAGLFGADEASPAEGEDETGKRNHQLCLVCVGTFVWSGKF